MEKTREHDLAWAAGVMDSDGSVMIRISRFKNKNSTLYAFHPSVVVGTTTPVISVKLKGMFGIGQIENRKHSNPNAKSYRNWWVSNYADCKYVLESLLPFLVLKRKQAELVIELCEVGMSKVGQAFTNEQKLKIKDIYERLIETKTNNGFRVKSKGVPWDDYIRLHGNSNEVIHNG